jgi:hypothetical protein
VPYGAKSPAVLQEGSRGQAEALPNAELRELERVSHNVKMNALAPVLADFFAAETDVAVQARDSRGGLAELRRSLRRRARDAFAGQLDRVGVAHARLAARRRNSTLTPALDQLVRREAAPQDRPRVGPSMMQNSGPAGSATRAVSQGRSCSQPQASMPISRRRPPLPRRTSRDPAADREALAQRERLLDPQPPRQSTAITARSRKPWRWSVA